MRRRQFNSGAVLALALGPAAPSGASAQSSAQPKAAKPKPSRADERGDPAKAVRLTLERGATAAMAELSKPNGFAGNPKVRIGLPMQMADTARFRRAIGRGQQFDELELALNRVAEQSVEAAGPPLRSLLRSLVVTDPTRLINGSPTAITDWFAGKVRAPLINQMLGPVSSAAEQAGLARQMSEALAGAPVASVFKGEDGGLSRYLARKVISAIFEGMAAHEQRLRREPASHPDALLRRTFGASLASSR